MKIHLVSLGCAKNLVDSEMMLGRLSQAGWPHTPDPGQADTIIINTCSFIEDVRFDHLGVFIYSDSEDLPSHRLAGHVPEEVSKDRYDRLMLSQSTISLNNNQNHNGRSYDILVETKVKENLFTGRTFFQAPAVDGITYVHSQNLLTGSFAKVKITDVLEYDLIGETG